MQGYKAVVEPYRARTVLKEENGVEELYGWVRNIIGYFLFLAVMDNLIPGKKYEKYIRLFAGMVAILLILQPLAGRLRLEEKLAYFYEALVFRYQSEDLKREILGMEKQRMEQMVSRYEMAAAMDVEQMAEDMGLMVWECQVKIGSEEGNSRFGMVERVQMRVSLKEEGEGQEEETWNRNAGAERGNQKATGWERVQIDPVEIDNLPDEKESASWERQQGAENLAVRRLRREILSYYGLEEAYVEIRVVEGEG